MFGEEMLEGTEEVRAEATFLGVGILDGVFGEEAGEEAMGKLFGFVFGFSFSLEETEDGSVVGLAKIGELL